MTAEIKTCIDEVFEDVVGRPPTDKELKLQLDIVEAEIREAREGNPWSVLLLEKVGLGELI